jgi:hypothetical protein
MFNVRDTKFVPGFNVREPVEEVPGFRVAPDGSTLQSSANISSSRGQSLGFPDSWLRPWLAPKPGPMSNLAFLGGGLAGMLGASTPPALQNVEPAAAGDLKCQGVCSLGGDRGMTGAYREGRDNLCAKCLVKRLGYENVPSSELPKLLEPWLIRGR